MAFTERYVTTTGLDTNGGTNDTTDAWDIVTGFAEVTSNIRVNVKAGNYTIPSDGLYTITTATTAAPGAVRGYGTTPGDGYLGRDSNGKLITTNFPIITIVDSSATISSTGLILENMKIIGDWDGSLVDIGAQNNVSNVIVENSSTGGSASCFSASTNSCFIGCEMSLTGASGGLRALTSVGSNVKLYGCRITGKNGVGVRTNAATTGGISVIGCTIFDSTIGIDIASTGSSVNVTIIDCTFYNCSTAAIRLPATAQAINYCIINCHATDCNRFINNQSATVTPLTLVGNRTRDNTNADNNNGNWYNINYITTDNGNASSDYVSTTNKNFTLLPTAVGRSAGVLRNRDVGAPQAPSSANSLF